MTDRMSDWERFVEDTAYLEEIKEYWRRVAVGEAFDAICKDIGARSWN